MKTAIIIGGGIAGCSSAYALAKRGISVTLIERHANLAQGASGNPVAMLYPKLNSKANLQSLLAVEGFNYTLALLKKLPRNDLKYNLCGQIQLAFNAREAEKQAALMNQQNTAVLELNIQQLSMTKASEKANLLLKTGGLYLPNAGWVKPKTFCKALIASKHIKTILSNAALTIQGQDNDWEVKTSQEKLFKANIVVICNATDIQQFEQCQHVPVTPVRGQINFFAGNGTGKNLNSVVCSDHYLSPMVDGFHSIGTTYAPNDLNAALSMLDTQANLNALKRLSPALYEKVDLSQVTGRVGWRSATKDYMPLAGQLLAEEPLKVQKLRYNDKPSDLPWLNGLYINAGHGSKGMITAPLCGELIANQICGESFITSPSIASHLNPNRFLLKDLGLRKIAQKLHSF